MEARLRKKFRQTVPAATRRRMGHLIVLGTITVPITEQVIRTGNMMSVVEGHREQLRGILFDNFAVHREIWNRMPDDLYYHFLYMEINGELAMEIGPSRPYRNAFGMVSPNGRQGLRQEARRQVDNFFSLRDSSAEGSDNHVSLDFKSVTLTLLGNQLAGGDEEVFPEGVQRLYQDIFVIEPPRDLGKAYRDLHNNCFFRCLKYHLGNYMKETPRTLRQRFKLQPTERISMEMGLTIATHLGIKLNIYHWKKPAFVNNYENVIENPTFSFGIVYREDEQHYQLFTRNAIPVGAIRLQYFRCERCKKDQRYTDYSAHMFEHHVQDLNERQRRQQLFTQSLVERQPGQSMEAFSQAYTQFYVDLITDHIQRCQVDPDNIFDILWLAGPGGCGKTETLRSLPEMKIIRLAPTGKAADLIGGETVARILSPYAKMDDFVDAELLVIDEIGMLTATQFDMLEMKIRHARRNDALFGGLPVILMGDFLQLPPIPASKNEPIEWCFESFIFRKYVLPLRMNYGWRYMENQEVGEPFFNFLMELRKGVFSELSFKAVQWGGVLSKSEWENWSNLHPDDPERPIALCMERKQVQEFQSLANRHDGNMDYPIPTFTYSLSHQPHIPCEVPMKVRDAMKLVEKDERFHFNPCTDIHQDISSNPLGVINKHCYDTDIYTGNCLRLGQKLIITTNYCGKNEEGNRSLCNGNVVEFVGVVDDKLIVEDRKGEQHSIERLVRYRKRDDTFYWVVYGYPFQLADASTVHKAQGSSMDKIAFYIPEKKSKDPSRPHLLYVAISRVRDPRKCYFVFGDTFRVSLEPIDSVYSYLAGYDKLLCKMDIAVEVMDAAERADGRDTFKIPDETFSEDNISSYQSTSLCTSDGKRPWRIKIPYTFGSSSKDPEKRSKGFEHEHQHLFKNTIVFDIETGASFNMSDHQGFFPDGKTWGCQNTEEKTRNQQSLRQDWWMVGAIYYFNGDVVWCDQYEELEYYARFQDPKTGAMRFQRGYGMDESDGETDTDPKWCANVFQRYLLSCCDFWENQLKALTPTNSRFIKVADYQQTPIKLVGYNNASFDSIGLVQTFLTNSNWKEQGFSFNVVPRSGTSYSNIIIKRKKNILLEMHDLSLLITLQGGLSGAHSLYVTKPFSNDPELFKKEIQARTSGSDLVMHHLFDIGFTMGKGVFPHYITRREGHQFTLIDHEVTLAKDDFPIQYHKAIEDDNSLLTFIPVEKTWEYMMGDLCATMATYIGVDVQIMKILQLSCLKINTTQQLTTYRLLIEEAKKKSASIVTKDENKSKGRSITTDLYLLDYHSSEFVKEAIYGGRTLPRVFDWESLDPVTDFCFQGDFSGMYSYVQQTFPFPVGKHEFLRNDATAQGKIMAHYRKARQLQESMYMANPPKESIFPHMFIARVRLKYPSLVVEPGVPFKNPILRHDHKSGQALPAEMYDLFWSLCEEGKDGERTQVLCNVDLAVALDDGCELEEVYEVLFWFRSRVCYHDYIEILNKEKYNEPEKKQMAKLCANANYGAALLQTKLDVQKVITQIDEDLCISLKELDLSKGFIFYDPESQNCILRGKRQPKETDFSQRPLHIGVFVLAWSRWIYQRAIRVAYGPLHSPKPEDITRTQLREHLLNQVLYGDTDSVYFHRSHMDRLIEHDRNQPLKKKILYEEGSTDNSIDKLGKITDEPSEHYMEDKLYHPNFSQYNFVKAVRFASIAPKTYTCKYIYEDHPPLFKSKCKGIPKNARMTMQVKDPELHLDVEVPEEYRETITFKVNCEKVHNYMYFAFKNHEMFMLCAQKDGVFKTTAINTRANRFTEVVVGEYEQQMPLEQHVGNLDRNIGGNDRYKKRRLLTDYEAYVLRISEEDRQRITVPIGFNYDHALSRLKPEVEVEEEEESDFEELEYNLDFLDEVDMVDFDSLI
jgi:hypothetical protein